MTVAVPCESGYMYDCNSGECQQCPGGSYQPQWGQTSCWPCPANTTTDRPGAASLDLCKSHSCPFYAKEGVGIMESPNYPRNFPVSTERLEVRGERVTVCCADRRRVQVARVPRPHQESSPHPAPPHPPARLLRLLHCLQVRAGPVQHGLLQLLLHPAPGHPHRAEQQPLGGVQGGPQVHSSGVPVDSSLCAG